MRNIFYLISVVTLVACSAHSGPIIDTKGVNMAHYEQDLADCEGFSDQIRVEQGVAKGAAAGAVIGAAGGAIGGDALEGAGVGAVAGGAKSGLGAARDKEAVVKRCMRGRGYRVLN